MAAHDPSEYRSEQNERALAITSAANVGLTYRLIVLAGYIDNLRVAIQNEHKAQKMQLDIGRRVSNRTKTYWPYEIAHLTEWSSKPEPEAPAVMGSRYAGRLLAPVAKAHMENIYKVKCKASRYCTSANEQAMQAAYLARAVDESQARVEGYNAGFTEYNDRRQVKFKRWLDAIALGNNAIDNAQTMLSSANAIRNNQANAAVAGIIGAASKLIQDQTSPIAGTSAEEWYRGNNFTMGANASALTKGTINNEVTYAPPDDDDRWNSDTTASNSGMNNNPGTGQTANSANAATFCDKGYHGMIPWPVPYGVCMVTIDRYPQIFQCAWVDRMFCIRTL